MAEAFWLLALVTAIPAAIACVPLERRRRVAMPDTQPYTWGLYLGLSTLLFGATGIAGGCLVGFTSEPEPLRTQIVMWTIGLGIAYVAAGYLALRRRPIGLILSIMLSMNVVWWVLGPRYVADRWSELRNRPSVR
jgi:hypothetical protein